MEELETIIKQAQNHDDTAMEEVLRKFKPKVIAISREYFLLGADFDDLIQEGMIGLYKAINVYDQEKNHNFSAFASLCIHRQLQNAVKLAARKKNQPLNNYLPIEYFGGVENEGENKKLIIVDDNSDFEKNFIDQEINTIMISRVRGMLNETQFLLLKLFLNGESYSNIANKLNITTKQVDNMLQTIKKKLKTIKGEF